MADSPPNPLKKAELCELTLPKMIKAMRTLHQRSKQDFRFFQVLSEYRIPDFSGSDEEYEFLIKALEGELKKEEDFERIREQLEKEKQLHLETIAQLELASPLLPRQQIDERIRLRSATHDSILNSLRRENKHLQSDLNTIVQHSEDNERLTREVDRMRKLIDELDRIHNEKIDTKETEHIELLSVYQLQFDESQLRIQELEEQIIKLKNESEEKLAKIAANPKHKDRLEQLWRENVTLGEQLDDFKKQLDREKRKNMPGNPMVQEKYVGDMLKAHALDMEALNKKNEDLSHRLDDFVGQLIDKDDLIREMQRELDAAKTTIKELKKAEEDGWKVLDAEDGV